MPSIVSVLSSRVPITTPCSCKYCTFRLSIAPAIMALSPTCGSLVMLTPLASAMAISVSVVPVSWQAMSSHVWLEVICMAIDGSVT